MITGSHIPQRHVLVALEVVDSPWTLPANLSNSIVRLASGFGCSG